MENEYFKNGMLPSSEEKLRNVQEAGCGGTSAPGNSMPSSGLCRPQAPMWYIYMHTGKALTHIKQKNNLKPFLQQISVSSVPAYIIMSSRRVKST